MSSPITPPVRLILGFHNHQPVGNFDGVIAQNFDLAYRPLIETFSEFPQIKFCLHVSGPLWEWIEQNQTVYFDKLAELMQRGQLELLTGAWSEPIMPMIPRRDRIGQIHHFRDKIQKRFGIVPKGMWLAERVWEPDLVESLARSGIDYTVLDDYHFHRAGIDPDKLNGYYLTEDQGYLLRLFPNSEPLRYLVPWREPEETIDYLVKLAVNNPGGTLAITADDGEKFGGWPGTNELIYGKKWLSRFLTLILENQKWIKTSTFSEAIAETKPVGSIYLPPASYREMTEWVLPPERLAVYHSAKEKLDQADPAFARPIESFFSPGGFWRNFLVKYPEAAEMAAHMRTLSEVVGRLDNSIKAKTAQGIDTSKQQREILTARTELYRAQCNCAFWHGAFGGLYLPHLRNAIYKHLILGENAVDRLLAPPGDYLRAIQSDFNADTQEEIRLDNRYLAAWISPEKGGQIYELDERRTATNLLATLNRRYEPYHDPVKKAAQAPAADTPEGPSNLHDRITLKHEGLDRLLVYDKHPRKALVDHLWPDDTTRENLILGTETEVAPWPTAAYTLEEVAKSPDRVVVRLSQSFDWDSRPVKIEKEIALERSSANLAVSYRLSGLSGRPKMKFGIEINVAAMPGHEEDRQFRDNRDQKLGTLDALLDLHKPESLSLADAWLDLSTRLEWFENAPDTVWTMPIKTVSNSEGGFEAIFQSTAIFAVWTVGGTDNESFEAKFNWRMCPSYEGC